MSTPFTPGTELGHLFEVGFTTGLLKALSDAQVAVPEDYQADLAQLKLVPLTNAMATRLGVVAETGRAAIARWITAVVTHGFTSGYAFWRELGASCGHATPRLRYLQLRFDGDNALGTVPAAPQVTFQRWLAQLGIDASAATQRYAFQAGAFLQADTLMLLELKREWRIVAVDLSIFAVQAIRELEDLTQPEVLRTLMQRELQYVRQRGQFAQISFDTAPGDLPVAEGLEHFYRAFGQSDKESVKLIQAGSYAYSFYQFLQTTPVLDARPVTFQVFGHSDRGVNAMTVDLADLDVLAQCHRIYQAAHQTQDATTQRDKVLRTIAAHASASFGLGGRAFVQALLQRDFRAQPGALVFRETVSGFTNTGGAAPPFALDLPDIPRDPSLRALHAHAIQHYLAPAQAVPLLFLTGAPGIGKTTALSEFCRAHRDEGFVFLYFSPRLQVNHDLLHKFDGWTQPEDALISLFTTAATIDHYGAGKPTVRFRSRQVTEPFTRGPVQFVPEDAARPPARVRERLGAVLDDQLEEEERQRSGVLGALCTAIQMLLRDPTVKSIVATAALQSLKNTPLGSTLDHIETIFADAYRRDKGPVWAKLQQLAQRRRHLIVMIDEITGDGAGVAFLQGLLSRFERLGLLDARSGFNTKIVVADASIVDSSIIRAHLQGTQSERDKVYFRKAVAPAAPLQVEPFTLGSRAAVAINASCYPASALELVYHVFLEAHPAPSAGPHALRRRMDDEVCQAIADHLEDPEAGQLLVYVQDKARIQHLIAVIAELCHAAHQPWGRDAEYLEIHADLGEAEKAAVHARTAAARVVFMTSTASRGLSFPAARQILVVVPGFAVEQNLMEIIQVLYRGRGDAAEEARPKSLHFFVGDQVVYTSEAHYEHAVRERRLGLLTLLLILKTAIMTRIQGYGWVGRDRVMMVPVGRKGVTAAGDSFGGRMAGTLRALATARRQHPQDGRLRRVEAELQSLLASSEVTLARAGYSYLELARQFERDVATRLRLGFDHLLDLPPLGEGVVTGSLLLVPVRDRAVVEAYYLRERPALQAALRDKIAPALRSLVTDPRFPESLQHQLRHALSLVTTLSRAPADRSRRIIDQTAQPDMYYALPLWVLAHAAVFRDYFATDPREPEGQEFRQILGQLVRAHYPVESMVPLGTQYAEFPWLLFRSHQLAELRRRVFDGRELMATTAFNVLHLILAREEYPEP